MSYSVGGAIIKRMTLTKAWGLSPASAEIEAVGAGVFSPGSSVALNIGSSTFFGIVGDCVERTTDQGKFLAITVPDNRIKLMWDTVYASFNVVEILEDNVATPGIDRFKRYVHVYPVDWDAQKKTRTDEPHTAAQILEMLVNAETVTNGWGINGHARLQKPVYGVDASRGKKLGTVIQEIIDQVGLIMTLIGSNSLGFAVKGEDSPPIPSTGGNSTDISDGSALGPDTRVRIVGDKSLYQDLPIDLEPDWNAAYEQFIFEPAWVAKCKALFGGTDGEAKAKSLTATLRECAIGDDLGKWGEVSRMEIPVWVYLHDIVFKAYRVPRNYTINGIDLDSLELRDGLLAEVESNASGALTYKTSNYYPETKAYCIARGQQLSKFDAKFLDSLTIENLAAWRNEWQPVNKFNLDTKNKVIIFEDPIFIDNGLFKAPNAGMAGLSSLLLKLVVPNANVQISAAPVRASLCFAAEVYSKFFGSGTRTNAVYISGLNYHVLMSSNSFGNEIPYISEKGADEIAADAGASALTGQNFLQSGGFTRIGSAGMSLNGSIDRITVNLQFEGGGERDGISELIDYATERSPIHFESERELERRGRVPDALKKIKEQKDEADQVRFTAKFLKPQKRQTPRPYQNLNSVMETPVGAVHGGTQTFSSEDTWLAGQPVFVNEEGIPAQDGKIFRGIIIADLVTGPSIATATQGTVPVRVKGPFEAGDNIGIDSGAGQTAKKDGALPLGKVNASYSGTDVITAPVRLGAGSGAAEENDPFSLIEGFNTDNPPKPTVGFVVGKFGNSIPTLDGTPLDGSPSPRHAVTTSGDKKAWLQVNISAAFDNYHPSIDDSEILIEAAAANPDREDFKIEWEDEENRVSGAFFVLIADFTVETIGAGETAHLEITSKDQWLRQNYRSIILSSFVGKDVILPVG